MKYDLYLKSIMIDASYYFFKKNHKYKNAKLLLHECWVIIYKDESLFELDESGYYILYYIILYYIMLYYISNN